MKYLILSLLVLSACSKRPAPILEYTCVTGFGTAQVHSDDEGVSADRYNLYIRKNGKLFTISKAVCVIGSEE